MIHTEKNPNKAGKPNATITLLRPYKPMNLYANDNEAKTQLKTHIKSFYCVNTPHNIMYNAHNIINKYESVNIQD